MPMPSARITREHLTVLRTLRSADKPLPPTSSTNTPTLPRSVDRALRLLPQLSMLLWSMPRTHWREDSRACDSKETLFFPRHVHQLALRDEAVYFWRRFRPNILQLL